MHSYGLYAGLKNEGGDIKDIWRTINNMSMAYGLDNNMYQIKMLIFLIFIRWCYVRECPFS